jgi:hypothetical protein
LQYNFKIKPLLVIAQVNPATFRSKILELYYNKVVVPRLFTSYLSGFNLVLLAYRTAPKSAKKCGKFG